VLSERIEREKDGIKVAVVLRAMMQTKVAERMSLWSLGGWTLAVVAWLKARGSMRNTTL
jgi:hypothetical protein